MGLFDEDFEQSAEKIKFKAESPKVKQQRWENKVVQRILTRFAIPAAAKSKILSFNTEKTGFLSFASFHTLYPSFPVWLACQKIPYVHEDLTPERMVNRWTLTKTFQAFVDAEANSPLQYQNGQGLGLVFEWLHVFPVAIISNHYHESEDSETVFKHIIRTVKPYQHMAIQSFDSFLASLGWTPDADC